MSLPAPSYAIQVSFTAVDASNALLDNDDAILIRTLSDSSPAGSPVVQEVIIWKYLLEYQQADLIELIDTYGGTSPIPGPVAATERIVLTTAPVGGDPTGYGNTGTDEPPEFKYIDITVDGRRFTRWVQGSEVSTYADLLTEVNNLLGGAATLSVGTDASPSFSGNDLVLTHPTPGTGKVTFNKGGDNNIFRDLQDFKNWGKQVVGVTDTREMLDANFALYPTNTV